MSTNEMVKDGDILKRVSDGKQCPFCCKTDNIRAVSSNPDGFNLNIGYDCDDCGSQWEGN